MSLTNISSRPPPQIRPIRQRRSSRAPVMSPMIHMYIGVTYHRLSLSSRFLVPRTEPTHQMLKITPTLLEIHRQTQSSKPNYWSVLPGLHHLPLSWDTRLYMPMSPRRSTSLMNRRLTMAEGENPVCNLIWTFSDALSQPGLAEDEPSFAKPRICVSSISRSQP